MVRMFCRMGAALAILPLVPAFVASQVPTFELVNGYWYIDGTFRAQTMYSVAGVIRSSHSGTPDSVIDLAGGYVVPAFGDAHQHRPDTPDRLESAMTPLVSEGVFYVMNQGNLTRYVHAMRDQPGQMVDVLYANAQIASAQSHSLELWQRLVRNGVFPGMTVDRLDGDAYVVVESSSDLEAKWADHLAGRPDFIKIMLEHSDEFQERRDDPAYFGASGLDPALVPSIVARAHALGLRVSAHIENAADFRLAVAGGVDVVAHLPGYNIRTGEDVATYRIDRNDAEQAARQGTIVVSTTLLSDGFARGDSSRLALMRANHAANLRILADAGVTLVAGSDSYRESSIAEVLNLRKLGVFADAELLQMLAVDTPRAIYPNRAIGALIDGSEANFVVLRADPTQDLTGIRDITLLMKDGRLIQR